MSTRSELVESVLNQLRKALGTGEEPDGSNHNFITEWYNANVDRIGNGPWCEMTNTWAMWTAGFKDLKVGRAYTVWAAEDGMHHAKDASWHWGTAGMMAGDQVYYDWSGAKGDVNKIDHTGTVERINGDGTFYTLEGNVSNRLQRLRRDSKYVVGYLRFDWTKVATSAPTPVTPPPPTRYTPDRQKTSSFQHLLEVPVDGYWGSQTDGRALLMRSAAQGHLTDVRLTQYVVHTPVDGIWGPHSRAALVAWVKSVQNLLGVGADGDWGPITDNAFLYFRKRNLNNF